MITEQQAALAVAAAELDDLARACGCAAHLDLQPTDDGGMNIKISVSEYGDTARFAKESGAILRRHGLDARRIGTA